jgi:hypothetical protein
MDVVKEDYRANSTQICAQKAMSFSLVTPAVFLIAGIFVKRGCLGDTSDASATPRAIKRECVCKILLLSATFKKPEKVKDCNSLRCLFSFLLARN